MARMEIHGSTIRKGSPILGGTINCLRDFPKAAPVLNRLRSFYPSPAECTWLQYRCTGQRTPGCADTSLPSGSTSSLPR